MTKKPASADGTVVVARNRRARFDYEIEETIEAGLVLWGSEVKSLRAGGGNLTDACAIPEKGELWLMHVNIPPYKAASSLGHTPLRKRKLLLHRREIVKLTTKIQERGCTLIPLSLYFKDGYAKVELGLARGKKQQDRRQSIKERDMKREVERELSRRK